MQGVASRRNPRRGHLGPVPVNPALCTAMMRGGMENSLFARHHDRPSLPQAAYGENGRSGGLFMNIRKFSSDIGGATAIEYGLIVACIALAIIGALQALGGSTGAMWDDNEQKITAAINGSVGKN